MKSLFIFLLFLLLISFSNTEISPFPFKNDALFWKIDHPNSNKSSYILGTMHLIEKEYFLYPNKLEKIARNADKFIMELKELPNQNEIHNYSQLKEGSFFDYFTPTQTDSIITWANENLGVDNQTFRKVFYKMKPYILAQMITQSLFIEKTESYELKFYDLAIKNNKTILGLETIENQFEILDSLSAEEQVSIIMESISNLDEAKAQLKKIQKLYSKQKIDSLYIELKKEFTKSSNFEKTFIDNRNYKWIKVLTQELDKSSCFVAVGAGHVGGPNGILRLLQKEGYTITPIKLN